MPGGLRGGAARRRPPKALAPLVLLALFVAAQARADDPTQWLARVAQAARTHNYVGTIVYQRGNRVETSRIVHFNQGGMEYEKLTSLDGPAREIVRGQGEVRFYYPDAKFVRVEPRTFRNAFPSLSPEQQKSLKEYYNFKIVAGERVGGIAADIVVFEPKDGLRYGHKFWTDIGTGLILKARVVDENRGVLEQFVFSDVAIGAKVDAQMVKPTWPSAPPGWKVRQLERPESETVETGWTVTRVPPGFVKIVDRYRGFEKAHKVAFLVYSDGLVSVSVFVAPGSAAPPPNGFTQQDGLNVYSRQVNDSLVTVIGQVPALTLRQIGNSVARR